MKSSHSVAVIATALVIALVGASCESSVPSPTVAPTRSPAAPSASVSPSSTPGASPSAEPSPGASESPAPTPTPTTSEVDARTYRADAEITDVVFALDGGIALVERDWAADAARVVSLDEHGAVLPGWPWSPGETGSPIAHIARGPDLSIYAAVRTESGDPLAFSWMLHRLDPGAHELAGFPVALATGSFCELSSTPDGTAWASCETEDEASGAVRATVTPVRPDGSTPAGWPVTFRSSAQIAGFRPDEAVVISTANSGGPIVTVLRPDGTKVGGWPRRMPDGGSVQVDTRGRVHIKTTIYEEDQCGAPIRTAYSVLRLNGTTVPGWPVTIQGWASEPLLGDDGSSTVLTAAGRTIRYGPNGTRLDGWNARGVPVEVGCSRGNDPVSAGDGAVVAVAGRRAMLIRDDGSVSRGWPVRLRGTAAVNCRDCTPGPDAALPPAVGNAGIWVAAYRNDRPLVIGIDRAGRMPAAWRRPIGRKGDEIGWVRTAHNGRIWALLLRWDEASESLRGLLVPIADDPTEAP